MSIAVKAIAFHQNPHHVPPLLTLAYYLTSDVPDLVCVETACGAIGDDHLGIDRTVERRRVAIDWLQGKLRRPPWLQVETDPHQKGSDTAFEQEPRWTPKEVIGGKRAVE